MAIGGPSEGRWIWCLCFLVKGNLLARCLRFDSENGLMARTTVMIVGEWLDELTRLAWEDETGFGNKVSRLSEASLLK
ncbi:unnamed protein product, partial [Dovyalis caffra]